MTGIPTQQTSTKRVHHSLKVDMTPMVDLGFLLITFFIFTTSMAEPKTLTLLVPADGESTPVKDSHTLTALLDKDKIYLYRGQWQKAVESNEVGQTNYNLATGLGDAIRQKQKELQRINQREELVFIIKPLPSSSYQNVVAALDEVLINNLRHYAVVDVTKEEEQFAKTKQ